jgi:hypothetical protein
MEERSSPARSMAPELNEGEGASPSGQREALGSGEAQGSVHGEGGRVSWVGTNRATENRGGCDRGGLLEGDNDGGSREPNRRGPLLIAARYVGATWACAEGEREVTARRGGRAMEVHARRRGAAAKEAT